MTDTEMLLETAELLDLVFYDVKHMDDETHREITGASNKKRFCQIWRRWLRFTTTS